MRAAIDITRHSDSHVGTEEAGEDMTDAHAEIDEEEVSLSDSSLSSDDDSSGDEGYEDSGITTDSSNDYIEEEKVGEDEGNISQNTGRKLLDEFDLETQNKLLYRRSVSVITPAHQYHRQIMSHERNPVFDAAQTTPIVLPDFNHGRIMHRREKPFRAGGYLDKIPPSMEDDGIPPSLTLSMAKQHVQLARSCLELLDEKDRQDALRRRNVRHTLLNGSNNMMIENDDTKDVEEDDTCLLLTMIKAGPLYKLHVKGGKASIRVSSKMKRSGKNNQMNAAAAGKSKRVDGVANRLLTKWKPKFLEVRKGILSYYNDSLSSSLSLSKKEGLVRKNIPLQSSTCVCRAVDYFGDVKTATVPEDDGSAPAAAHYAPTARCLYAFELIVEGLPPRLFAAGTEAGRQDWIRSICKGMVGCSSGESRSDSNVGDSNRVDLRKDTQMQKFMTLSQAANAAKTDATYADNFLKPLWGTAISLPTSSVWNLISPLLVEGNTGLGQSKFENEGKARMHSDFWYKLKHFNFSLNGRILRGQSVHGPERFFAALMRCILECDKSNAVSRGRDAEQDDNFMTEIQAARYARDILKVTVGEYRGRALSLEMAVKALCKNGKDLAVIGDANSTKEAPIIKINASSCIQIRNDSTVEQLRSKNCDRREWLQIRTSGSKSSKRYFAVLSVGVLCFYREKHPIPHKLIEQLYLVGAKVGTWEHTEDAPTAHPTGNLENAEGSMISSECNSNQSSKAPRETMKRPKYIIHVVSKDKKRGRRQLCFIDYEQFSEWRDALVSVVESCSSSRVLGVDNPTSMDELSSEQQQPSPSARGSTSLTSTYTRPSRSSSTSEPDNDGITWVTFPAASALEQATSMKMTSSRLQIGEIALPTLSAFRATTSRRLSNSYPMMPSLSAFRVVSSRLMTSSESSITSTISSIPGRAMSAASRRLPKKIASSNRSTGGTISDGNRSDSERTMEDDIVLNIVEPTVELEIQFSTFHHLAVKKQVLTTIRASCIQRFHLSGGKRGGLTKGQEIIKLDAAKGMVRRNIFESMYDVERRPKRRA
eukprot:CAMPEP_0172325504 /NCGR_PEP_ID=MMETSP1058-20130122/54217_1 /TAXON_ID=83371 /ORGANISM="Detonula confervacea, Strain CCMP 353" /LENGTH=1046 /DNA_ID=CAMNT_0013042073 /DNA_START=110 /DNA_END=3246 /DNA_ORIENTATION=-